MIAIKNLRNEKPTKPWQVKVDRSSPLGNPYHMTKEIYRDEVYESYEKWLMVFVEDTEGYFSPQQDEIIRLINLYKQYGKLELFCWCAPKRCHAEVIKNYIERTANLYDK